ncbi:MAG: hypothetical protein AB1831_02610 [Pseudomonadota bacterium]
MKRNTLMLIALAGVALLSSAAVFAQGGQGGMPGAAVTVSGDRLQTRDRDRLHDCWEDVLFTVDMDQDRLRDKDRDQLKDQDQDRDRINKP